MSVHRKHWINPVSLMVFVVLAGTTGLLFILQILPLGFALAGVVLSVALAASIQIADQWEKAVVLRMGKFTGLKGPGPFLIIPVIDRVANYVDQRVRVTDFIAAVSPVDDEARERTFALLESRVGG